MKNEENSTTGIDAATKLSEQIHDKCQVHKALSIAIGAIHYEFNDLTKEAKTAIEKDLDYISVLVQLSVGVTNEIEALTEQLSDMILSLKSEIQN